MKVQQQVPVHDVTNRLIERSTFASASTSETQFPMGPTCTGTQ